MSPKPLASQIATVGVYRKEQPLFWSPCILGDPCGICRAHQLNKKLRTPCLRQQAAESAFEIPVRVALALVNSGEANFVHDRTAIQLTFSKFAHLRGESCRIEEEMLIRYATGRAGARAAVDFGWGVEIPDVTKTKWTPAQVAVSEAQVRSFV